MTNFCNPLRLLHLTPSGITFWKQREITILGLGFLEHYPIWKYFDILCW